MSASLCQWATFRTLKPRHFVVFLHLCSKFASTSYAAGPSILQCRSCHACLGPWLWRSCAWYQRNKLWPKFRGKGKEDKCQKEKHYTLVNLSTWDWRASCNYDRSFPLLQSLIEHRFSKFLQSLNCKYFFMNREKHSRTLESINHVGKDKSTQYHVIWVLTGYVGLWKSFSNTLPRSEKSQCSGVS